MNNGHSEPVAQAARRFDLAAGEGGETSLLRILRMFRRRFWIFLLVFCGMVTLAYFYAVTRQVSYRSEAAVEVGPDAPVRPAELIGEGGGHSSPPFDHYFRTQVALLRRDGLLKQVLDSLPPEEVAEYLQLDNPVRALSERMTIEAVPSTFLIQIGLEHRSAEHGPAIVNRLVERFIEDSNRRLRDNVEGTMDRLSKVTLPELRRSVEQAEKAAQAFLDTAGLGDLAERHASLLAEERRLSDRRFEVRMRQVGLRTKTEPGPEDLRVAMAVLPADPGGRSVESLAARRTEIELELARLKSVLKDKHATVVALREQLATVNVLYESALGAAVEATEKIRKLALHFAIKRVEAELAAADEEERALAKEEKPLNERILAANDHLAHYQKLEAEVTAARSIFNTYLTKQAELKAMAGAGVVGVRVVELAGKPVGKQPNTHLILTLGVVLGLLLGAGTAIIVEQNDDRASMPYEAEAVLGLELLVSVPRLPRQGSPGGVPLVPKDHPLNSPLESFRRLRSEVTARLQGQAGSKVVAILGADFGEGKSTVAVNLARVLGLDGQRVLLFDAEFRRPRLKALLADADAPGLEEYLRANLSLRKAIQETAMPGVDVLGASRAMDEAPEMPGMARFQDLWRKARAEYDYIIVDAGPVNSFSEVAALASQADASIMVMDERRTRLRHVQAAKRILENLEARILGLVVNRSLNPAARGPASGWTWSGFSPNGNGSAEAPIPAAAPAPIHEPSDGNGNGNSAPAPYESPVMRTMLDRLMKDLDLAREKADGLATHEKELRTAFAEGEREYSRRLQEEIQRSSEASQRVVSSLDSSVSREDARFSRMESLFTKSLEGVNKKLTDLRLRSFAGGAMGSEPGAADLRPSALTIEGILGKPLESNVGSFGKAEGKAGGKLSSALDRLKNLRAGPAKNNDEPKK